MLTPVVAVDRYDTANRGIAPGRAWYLFSQLVVGETGKNRESLGTNLLTKRDRFAEAHVLMLIHPRLVHRVNNSHDLFLGAPRSVRRSSDTDWAGMAFYVPLDDPVEGHFDANQM